MSVSSDGLLGRWSLLEDGRDASGHGLHADVAGSVQFGASLDPSWRDGVARIDRGRGHLAVPGATHIGTRDFTVAAWVNPDPRPSSPLGDIAACIEPGERRGFTLGFQDRAVCGSHVNDRNLFFGIDAASEPEWSFHGSPSPDAVMIYALTVFENELYAATWEEGPHPRGHVYRRHGDAWVDCGSPWDTNAVTRLSVFEGHLFAGVSRVKAGGSGRPDSLNPNPGGHVLRYEGGTEWSDWGHPGDSDSVGALVPFDGSLYAHTLYTQGVYRLSTDRTWEWCGTPGRRLLALGVHDGALYAAGNDHANVEEAIRLTREGVVVPAQSEGGGGGVFRYEGGDRWTNCGMQPDTTQIYSIETHDSALHISSWPSGLVFRLHSDGRWESIGRLGDETEVMPLVSLNGSLYAGTLPHAQVYRFDGTGRWTALKTLDTTPDVMYRRAHGMCVFGGDLWCGTLPAADVWSMRTGLSASVDMAMPPGWHHIAALRERGRAAIYVDGIRRAERADGDGTRPLDLGPGAPLVLGGGPRAGFAGELSDVRFYARALDGAELSSLARDRPHAD